MKFFYNVNASKQTHNSATKHKEPVLQGRIITKIGDATTAGDYKLVVVECNESQHAINLSHPGVIAIK